MTSIDLGRRRFLLAAPAVILTPGLLMRVRPIYVPQLVVYGSVSLEIEAWLLDELAADLRAMLMPPPRSWFALSLSAQEEKNLLLGLPALRPGTP